MSNLLSITDDVAGLRTGFVNVYFLGQAGQQRDWVLIDAGLPWSARPILRAVRDRFGPDARPRAIVLTHGHFDHVGALHELSEHWAVPIYAHAWELPYLTGRSAYPPPDPTVGGGLMARSAYLYPYRPIDLGRRVLALPPDGSVPFLPHWRWLHTPGHTPGHVSLFRDADRLLIAGDAFVTTRQESALAVLTQHRQVHRPPAYFTPDWPAARDSVRRLTQLDPQTAATGHGHPMQGRRLHRELHRLADRFDELAVPSQGRYVGQPARADADGVTDLPPRPFDPFPLLCAVGVGVAAAALAACPQLRSHRAEHP